MANSRHRLSAIAVKNAREPGVLSDGAGLRLIVQAPERKRWEFRYRRNGRERFMSLGDGTAISLARAREKAEDARKLLAEGIDPLDARHASRKPVDVETPPKTITLQEACEAYIRGHEAGWKSRVHRKQWSSTLAQYAYPLIGAEPVEAIGTPHMMKVLDPIWRQVPETATRVRGRLEAVLAYATVQGWRAGPNPAIWRGHLQLLLPPKSRVRPVEHHASLPWQETPGLMARLRTREGIAARALQFLVLTAARSGEVRGMEWKEVDLARALWTVPPHRMKGNRAHRVPLSVPALALLRQMHEITGGIPLVFPGMNLTTMSDMTISAVLKRLGRTDLTVHGFRSTFRMWCAECTAVPRELAEAALAHTLESKVEAAYQRSDLLEKRRQLMADWAAFLTPVAGRDLPAELAPHRTAATA